MTAWRASGEDAGTFCRREGCSAHTLRWWASKLKREAGPEVRLARVVRRQSADAERRDGRIVIEAAAAGARVAVEGGVDRATLAMVLELLGVSVGAGGRP